MQEIFTRTITCKSLFVKGFNDTRCDAIEFGFPGTAIRRELMTSGTFHIANTVTYLSNRYEGNLVNARHVGRLVTIDI
jgi:hypothetical protein